MSFIVDDEFDNSFIRSTLDLAEYIRDHAENMQDEESLTSFVFDKDRFDPLLKLRALVSVVGLSEERLKRVVSLLRYRYNEDDFRTEWSVKRILGVIQEDPSFKSYLFKFLLYGRDSELGEEIPLYYMRNFRLQDPSFIQDLKNTQYVERVLSDNEIYRKYSNEVGKHVEQLIRNQVEWYRQNIDRSLRYEVQKELPLLNKNIDLIIPSVQNPRVLIEVSYMITTGSSQSKRADQLVEFHTQLVRHNANHPNRKIIIINYCDGFGWVGRQNDLRRIHDSSDYVINQKNLRLLGDILTNQSTFV